jgi:hypothetical protein
MSNAGCETIQINNQGRFRETLKQIPCEKHHNLLSIALALSGLEIISPENYTTLGQVAVDLPVQGKM